MVNDPQWLEEIVAATTSFVGTADVNGRPLWVNHAGRALCGLSPADPLPQSMADFHPAWVWPLLSEGVAVAAREGLWRGETAVLDADGTEVPVAHTLLAHHDRAGQLKAVSTIMRDLRGARRLNAELRGHARLLAAVGEAVIATDPEGHVEYWNRAAESLYGWTAREAVGCDMTELTVSDTEKSSAETIMAALRRGEAWSGVFRARDKEGATFPTWVTDTPVLDERGRLVKIIGVSTDLSELHTAREQAQRRADQQAALARLGQETLDAENLDDLLQRVCQATAKIFGADRCEVFELAPGGQQLWLRAAQGWPDSDVGRATVDAETGSQLGYALQCDTPVVVSDVATETRFAVPDVLVQPDGASSMSAAISPHDGPYGVLSVHSVWPRRFTEADTAFLHSVAHLVASAVSHHRTARELEQLALYDSLTGLANRAQATSRLTDALADTAEAGRVGVVVLDLDGFKLVNDGLGHHHGDHLLQQVARGVSEAVQHGHMASRLGSDEFAVLCPSLADDESMAIAECRRIAGALRDAISGHYELAPGMVYVTASVGVAVSADHEDAVELLRDAQAAVSAAKRDKHGGLCVYDQPMRARAARQIEVASDVREGLARDEFFMCYQAEPDLRTGKLWGIEALLRWRHPTRGALGPDAFLSVAEDTGLIVPLGTQALHRALEDLAPWLAHLDRSSAQLAVNVAAGQLNEGDFVAVIDNALASYGLAGHNLMLEITETALINNPATVAETLAALRDRGIQIAVDDFGTGYSSLTHLAHFPIDVVKIDRSFVAGLPTPDRHRQIVEAVVRLAHTMELTCVAEGVETQAQLDDLRTLGCDVGQGYLWGRPQPVEVLASWFDEEPCA